MPAGPQRVQAGAPKRSSLDLGTVSAGSKHVPGVHIVPLRCIVLNALLLACARRTSQSSPDAKLGCSDRVLKF